MVRRIFELCAAGHGTKAIAKTLNAAGAPTPRAQQGRPHAWAPSSVREILHRRLYRGGIVWNQSRKRDKWGRKHQTPRSVEEHVVVLAPHLRVVSEELWTARIGAWIPGGRSTLAPRWQRHAPRMGAS